MEFAKAGFKPRTLVFSMGYSPDIIWSLTTATVLLPSTEINPLYEFFKYETENTWQKALALANGVKQERKGLSDFIQGM
ncbi:MAG: hypothetical protein ACOYVD_12200 [Bacillota bacterium]